MKIPAFLLGVLGLLAAVLAAQQRPQLNDGDAHGDPPFMVEDGWMPLLNGHGVSGWHARDGKPVGWFTTRYVLWDRLLGPTRLSGSPAPSGEILNGPHGRESDLITDRKFGDIELYVEFLIAKGSNSGVFLQSLYEVQIFDSYQSTEPMTSSDAGGIYHQWVDNNHGVGGSAPSRNMCRPPGQWQSFQIWFRAPRFDAAGHKTENARFLRVLFNGMSVQNNVETAGPTRAHLDIPEAAENPLMLQGDHGPVAFRNIYWRPLRPIIER